MNNKEYLLQANPVCNANSIIQGDKYRISVLTDSLLRFEYNENGIFEDRATQTVLDRNFPEVSYDTKETDDLLIIYTDYLEVQYDKKEFTAYGLSVKVYGKSNSNKAWHYGEEPRDLGGTARTLDNIDGEIPLEHGIMSLDGFSIIDDSNTVVFNSEGMIEARKEKEIDFYFFGYGLRYLDALKDFYHLCGKTPLLPKYCLGNWWSRFYPYTQEEYTNLMKRFREEKIPFTVAVLDMDWHWVNEVDPKYGNGWTGYSWNTNLFPDHVGLLDYLHKIGMKTSLNVHPADGIRAYEDLYPRVAKAMGMNPKEGKTVTFDATNPKFMEVYFNELHHPLEEEGVDFWWLDWQQGTQSKIDGLDPLWLINHCHYINSSWNNKRALTFSRYAGPGSHRYPIGFSGDTVTSWDSLKFQPFFTATASNIGYGWWSHDIGGHMNGSKDDELTARWIQYGVFSPINRLHSSNNVYSGKEPWNYGLEARKTMNEHLRLRHKMIPYLYTMNRRASREDLPLVQPLYYLEPDNMEVYRFQHEYYFGSELLVSPITAPVNNVSKMAKAMTWLPKGKWLDMFTGVVYDGGRAVDMWRNINSIPVLMKEGAIIPFNNLEMGDNSLDNPEKMEILIFPAANGEFVLWEDQGDEPEDLDENWASTRMRVSNNCFVIEETVGNLQVVPEKRSYKLDFMATENNNAKVLVDGQVVECNQYYDKRKQSIIIEINDVLVTKTIKVEFEKDFAVAKEDYWSHCNEILGRAQASYEFKARAIYAIENQGKNAISTLTTFNLDRSVLEALIEILTARIR